MARRPADADPVTVHRPDWPLETARLVLRPWEETDFDFLEALYSDETVVRYLYPGPRTGDQIRDLFAQKMAGATLDAEDQWLGAAAVARDSGEVVADICMPWASETHKQRRMPSFSR
jgi:RimJ/RimL family protein N-acetyltransferase